MSARVQDRSARHGGHQLRQRELQAYLWGVGLALVLTLAAFGLVYFGHAPPTTVYLVVGWLAFIQMMVHFRFFLHIGLRQKREDLQLILFSAMLLVIMIGGTVWVMSSLATRMAMPGLP